MEANEELTLAKVAKMLRMTEEEFQRDLEEAHAQIEAGQGIDVTEELLEWHRQRCETRICQAMRVCHDVALFQTFHDYLKKRDADHRAYIQEHFPHYPNIEFTEEVRRQQTVTVYLDTLAMVDEN